MGEGAAAHALLAEFAFAALPPMLVTRGDKSPDKSMLDTMASYQEAMMKAERLAVCRQLCPKPAYALDRLAEAAGHHILRTPQYHPEPQPIENCWAAVKNHCAAQCDSTMAGLRVHLR